MTGFLEESPGVRSMTRLTILLTIGLSAVVVGSTCAYLFVAKEPNPAVIGAMGAVLVTLVVKCVVAITNRNGQADETNQ